MSTFETVREIALALPGMEDAISYGTPGLKVQGRFFARLREEDVLALRMGFAEREALMDSDPEAFFLTEHYVNYPAVLVRLSRVRKRALAKVLRTAWEVVAAEKPVKAGRARPRRRRPSTRKR